VGLLALRASCLFEAAQGKTLLPIAYCLFPVSSQKNSRKDKIFFINQKKLSLPFQMEISSNYEKIIRKMLSCLVRNAVLRIVRRL
jgi:hypothetical protein